TSILGTNAFGLLVLLWQASPAASPAGGEGLSITKMIKSMGPVAITVVIILLIMSVYSIAIMVERYLTYSAAKKQSREFAPRVARRSRTVGSEKRIILRASIRNPTWQWLWGAGLGGFLGRED